MLTELIQPINPDQKRTVLCDRQTIWEIRCLLDEKPFVSVKNTTLRENTYILRSFEDLRLPGQHYQRAGSEVHRAWGWRGGKPREPIPGSALVEMGRSSLPPTRGMHLSFPGAPVRRLWFGGLCACSVSG